MDELAAPGGEAELREAVLRYTREIAFGAAQVYARTAEARGAWDARLEALVVEALVRGEVDEGLQSWAAALNWSSAPVSVIAGYAGGDEPAALIDELGVIARRARLDLLAGVHGHRLVVVLGGTADPLGAARQFAGPVRRRAGGGRPGGRRPGVGHRLGGRGAGRAARRRRVAGRAAPGAGQRPAARARPGRRRAGPGRARSERVYEPLQRGGGALLDTAMTYLELGSSLEATARTACLFTPIPCVTGCAGSASSPASLPGDGRGGFSLWVAVRIRHDSRTMQR